ncbi:NUDIX domain-containing protein [Antarctobacter heliothermus]|uniref:8-oxo-dGTP diphosphatase n=1 Tax=Antarctobacter heliothermus TaxID=74033 RepID=A0A239BPX0_9RHOB|nr:NUDIX hydrolase [Antarctobacter heliothermus]SNS10050.1 8-oxo-dGTP diphosphatase [Antarctobacter heliothermus]
MTPRFGKPPQMDRRYTLRPGAYAILPRDGRLLLTRQDAPCPEVQLPGGGIDPGENPLQALHREIFEETGWRIARPRRLGAFRRFTFMPDYGLWAEKLCIIYTAMPVCPHGPPTEPGHTAIWRTPEAAAHELGNPGDRAFVLRHGTSG